mmetsp:Transcript_122423/g.225516  ORF Transcript_122423/g.225516 Transcript_122423/m.225516 type:complete len:256 (+) Transcript_122423:98-865(+)
MLSEVTDDASSAVNKSLIMVQPTYKLELAATPMRAAMPPGAAGAAQRNSGGACTSGNAQSATSTSGMPSHALGCASSAPSRRRPRPRTEPESEPEVHSQHIHEILLSDSDSERECVLAPQLKRLRLTEDPFEIEQDEEDPHAHDAMAVDLAPSALAAVGSESPVCPEPEPLVDQQLEALLAESPRAAGGLTCSATHVQKLDSGSTSSNTARSEAARRAEAWRAEIERRALDEIRRYRQAMRNLESGPFITECTGF